MKASSMRTRKFPHIYSCYTLYRMIYGGSPALKAHEALVTAEILRRHKFIMPVDLIEFFGGNGEHRDWLETALRQTTDAPLSYTSVDLYAPKADTILDLGELLSAKELSSVTQRCKTDNRRVVLMSFRSIETTVTNRNGDVTVEPVKRVLINASNMLTDAGGLVVLDITGGTPEASDSYDDYRYIDRASARELEQLFTLPVGCVSDDSILEFNLENGYKFAVNNYTSRVTKAEFTAEGQKYSISIRTPLQFRYWSAAEVIQLADECGLELAGAYRATEDLLNNCICRSVKPFELTESGTAPQPNKLVFRRYQ